MRKCGNCRKRAHYGWGGLIESCMDYEMACSEEEEIATAAECRNYEEGTPECLRRDEYAPSATAGDYSPSNPWDAPGMSIRDFI